MRGRKSHSSSLLLVLSLPCFLGCGPVPVQIKTSIRPDGSCDREVLQPSVGFLPKEAVEPEWISRWRLVEWRNTRQQPIPVNERAKAPFVFLKGAFASVADIPDHYAYAGDQTIREAAVATGISASVLRRSFQARDLGFLVECAFTETITNPRDPVGAAAAAQELAAQSSKWFLKYIDTELARRYDVSALSEYARHNIRSFVLDFTLELMRSPGAAEPLDQLSTALQKVAPPRLRELGIDADRLVKAKTSEEFTAAVNEVTIAMIRKLTRHADGRPLTEKEALNFGISEPDSGPPPIDDVLRDVVPPLVRIFRLYLEYPLGLWAGGGVAFTCTVDLPGQVFETNGRRIGAAAVRWRFDGRQLFGGDYSMSARSVVLAREVQRQALGRVPIHDLDTAERFLDLVGESPKLQEALGAVRAAKSLAPLEKLSLPVGPEARQREKLLALLAGGEPDS